MKQLRDTILLTLLACATMATPRAHAQQAPHVSLSWTREAGTEVCADLSAIQASVVAYLEADPWHSQTDVSLLITAHVSRTQNGFHLHIESNDVIAHTQGTRDFDVAGDDCSALTETATLALVLMIAPDGLQAPTPVELNAAQVTAPSLETAPAPFFVMAGGTMTIGHGVSGGGTARVGYAVLPWLSTELAANFLSLGGIDNPPDRNAFAQTLVITPGVCAVPVSLGERFGLRGCAGVGLGALFSHGAGYTESASRSAFLAEGSVSARGIVRITRGFGLEIGLNAHIAFTRTEIVGQLGSMPFTHYQTPPAAFGIEIGFFGGEHL